MRKAEIYLFDRLAGHLREDEEGYWFQYDREYLGHSPIPVSFTLPLQEAAFHDNRLFPFFDGLIPEGWLLDIVVESWKVNPRDRMGLLLACCRDCIGAVSIREVR